MALVKPSVWNRNIANSVCRRQLLPSWVAHSRHSPAGLPESNSCQVNRLPIRQNRDTGVSAPPPPPPPSPGPHPGPPPTLPAFSQFRDAARLCAASRVTTYTDTTPVTAVVIGKTHELWLPWTADSVSLPAAGPATAGAGGGRSQSRPPAQRLRLTQYRYCRLSRPTPVSVRWRRSRVSQLAPIEPVPEAAGLTWSKPWAGTDKRMPAADPGRSAR